MSNQWRKESENSGRGSDLCKIKFDLQRQRILKLEDMLTNHIKEHSGCITDITQALSNVNYQVDVLIEQVDRNEEILKLVEKRTG